MAGKLLTDTAIRALKQPKGKNLKVMVGGCPGLYLDVSHRTGEKFFRLQYRFNNKPHLLTLGHYPTMTLNQARADALRHKEDIRRGINPCAEKRAAKAESKRQDQTFRTIAGEWMEKAEATWGPEYRKNVRQKLSCYVFPRIGDKPIAEVTKHEVKAILDSLDARGTTYSIKRVRGIIGNIFKYALLQDVPGVQNDPTMLLKGKGLFSSHKGKHLACLTSPKEVAGLMKSILAYGDKSLQTCLALKFSALTFARPGEVRHAEWAEIDWADKLWRIPAEKMKMSQPHLVPLASQVIEILEQLRPMTAHNSRYLFPSIRTPDRPMSEITVLAALRRMGFEKHEMCAHGFRGLASSLLNEQGFNRDWIERQLAHSDKDSTRASYNHTDYLNSRREMMQSWANYLWQLAGVETTSE